MQAMRHVRKSFGARAKNNFGGLTAPHRSGERRENSTFSPGWELIVSRHANFIFRFSQASSAPSLPRIGKTFRQYLKKRNNRPKPASRAVKSELFLLSLKPLNDSAPSLYALSVSLSRNELMYAVIRLYIRLFNRFLLSLTVYTYLNANGEKTSREQKSELALILDNN